MPTVSRNKAAPTKKAASRPAKGGAQADSDRAVPVQAATPSDGRAAARTNDPKAQASAFERAVQLFNKGDFAAAIRLFEEAMAGPVLEMAHSAQQHARMCAKRLARPEMMLRTPDEHYDYAVALINERRIEQAERHLLLALAQNPKADHLFYALALCRGLSGDLSGAYGNLKRAIELQPRNRAVARNDPDFAEIGQLPPLAELLYPERATSG
jgi:tetratricopeptide (TPR) repeat protein